MARNNNDEPTTVNMLLDIEKVYGESNRRLTPIIITLCVAGAPLLLYGTYLIQVVPMWVFVIFEIIWAVRWAMIIVGEEQKRLAEFKKICYDKYSTMYELLNIKYIHEDGLIEYINGQVAYLIICENGNKGDDVIKSQMTRSILTSLTQSYTVNVYVQNFDAGEILESRYNNIKSFKNRAAMKDCMDMVQYNIKLASDNSFLTRTVIAVKGRRNEYKNMKYTIDGVLNSPEARNYKSMRYADEEEVKRILSYDLDAHVDYEDLLMNRYGSDNYDVSKVLSYDKDINLEALMEQKENYEEGEGFIGE